MSESQVPDDVYEEARRHLSDEELVSLAWAVVVINGRDRIAIAFRAQAGSYEPRKKA